MNYEELVKALRYCSTTEGMVYCNVNCKYGWEERSGGCKDILMLDAAAAIEALQAQLEDRTNQDEKDKILEDLRNVPVRPIGPIEPMQIELIKPHWVSVEDSMPDLLQFVLVCNDDWKCVVAQYVGYQTDGTTPWRIAYSMYDTDAYLEADEGPVCYWMTLPEPPQEVQDGK